MADFTKWEKKSVKVNLIFPLVFVLIGLILVVALFAVKPKPPEVQKKDAATSEEVEAVGPEEDIDWDNF